MESHFLLILMITDSSSVITQYNIQAKNFVIDKSISQNKEIRGRRGARAQGCNVNATVRFSF